MDEFRGIKARMQEMGVEKPLSRRARKRRDRGGIDLSSSLTPEQAQRFIQMIDDILPTMERPQ